jgi:prolyl oligopeptidase
MIQRTGLRLVATQTKRKSELVGPSGQPNLSTMAIPPPSPSRPFEAPPEGHGPSLGGILFGVVFAVLAALIFTIALQTPDSKGHPVVASSMPSLPLHYPPTRRVDASDVYFGVKVADPYRWLEDGKSPEVQTWLGAQNKLARSYLDAMPGRAALKKRYAQILHIDTVTAPEREGDRYFYMKRKADQEKSILYWRSATDPVAPEHVLIDPNQFIATNNAALGASSVTLDGKLLAYTLKPNNADEATLYVKNVETGQDIPGEVIQGAKYAEPSWLPDGSGFVYTYLPPADPAHPEDRPGLAIVRFHKLGTDPNLDPIIHAKTGDPTKFIGADVSRDGKWIFFEQDNGGNINDLYYQPLKGQPTAAIADSWKPIVVGKDFAYSLEAWQGQAYILTNEDAPHYRLFKVGLDDPSRVKWREIVPESGLRVLQDVDVVGNLLVLDELENVTSRIEIHDLDGKLIRPLDLPGLGTAGADGNPDFDELFYSFANFTQPPEIFRTSVTNAAQTLWAKIEIPVNPAPYAVEQKFFSSKDGTQVPMFIVHRKDMPYDGSTPFVIYGYGGFDISERPSFWASAYPWLEAGGGFALVNLRGGGEFGEQWHQQGMLLKKQNVFDDCIAAAEYLIQQGYTAPNRLALRGGSNGGLLAGAVLTQRPDLFRAVVCEAPLLDMIRYTLYGGGKTWIPEYGSPEDPDQFKALYAYSPYHHVHPHTPYPSVLFCTPQNDDRVAPMHAFKMTAALQAATSSPNPILLRLETQSGHTGGDQVSKSIEYNTDVWGFLIHELGATAP